MNNTIQKNLSNIDSSIRKNVGDLLRSQTKKKDETVSPSMTGIGEQTVEIIEQPTQQQPPPQQQSNYGYFFDKLLELTKQNENQEIKNVKNVKTVQKQNTNQTTSSTVNNQTPRAIIQKFSKGLGNFQNEFITGLNLKQKEPTIINKSEQNNDFIPTSPVSEPIIHRDDFQNVQNPSLLSFQGIRNHLPFGIGNTSSEGKNRRFGKKKKKKLKKKKRGGAVRKKKKKKKKLKKKRVGAVRKSTRGGWTSEEDEILKKAVKEFDEKNWKKVSEQLEGRTPIQCLHRWQKVLNPFLVKGPWTEEEDRIVKKKIF